jgi:hypothetical protein
MGAAQEGGEDFGDLPGGTGTYSAPTGTCRLFGVVDADADGTPPAAVSGDAAGLALHGRGALKLAPVLVRLGRVVADVDEIDRPLRADRLRLVLAVAIVTGSDDRVVVDSVLVAEDDRRAYGDWLHIHLLSVLVAKIDRFTER